MTAFEERYRALEEAEGRGEMIAWLERVGADVEASALDLIRAELEAIRALPEAERAREIDWALRYWSREREKDVARGRSTSPFEDTSLRLPSATRRTDDQLHAGDYEADKLAQRVLDACERYDRDVFLPLVRQVRDQLHAGYPDANFLLLGRDFTTAYVYLSGEGTIAADRLHLCNVSRNVRDVCLADPSGERLRDLRAALAACGLPLSKILGRDLVVVDTSMKGKIPAVIFKALAIDLSDEDAFELLSRCHVRYVKSGRRKPPALHEAALRAGTPQGGRLSPTDRARLLERLSYIEEFQGLRYPPTVGAWIHRRHKVFEWRPKGIHVAVGIAVPARSADATDARTGARLYSEVPQTPCERLLCALGQRQDALVLRWAKEERARRQHGRTSRGGAILAPSPAGDPARLAEQIDAAAAGGVEALKRWQGERVRGASGAVLRETKDELAPLEVLVGDRTICRVTEVVGEGNNCLALATERGTVVKVVKEPRHARKTLLLAWAEGLVRGVGIEAARVLDVSPAGLYVEQEYVPGESLEQRYGGLPLEQIPAGVIEQALADHASAWRLIEERGIYLDLKSANYQLRADGRIVIIDYTPRVNGTHYRYFRHDDGRRLRPEEFLDLFFNHDLRKRCRRR